MAAHLAGMGSTWVMKSRHLFPTISLEEYAAAMERAALRLVGRRSPLPNEGE